MVPVDRALIPCTLTVPLQTALHFLQTLHLLAVYECCNGVQIHRNTFVDVEGLQSEIGPLTF